MHTHRSSVDHHDALALADVLVRQSELNRSVCRALEAVALTADRYDAELTELRDEICALGNRIESLTRLMLELKNREALS